jgi:hypothetical protein
MKLPKLQILNLSILLFYLCKNKIGSLGLKMLIKANFSLI